MALRVAFDAVPLLDTRTGVGRFVDETSRRLAARPDLRLTAYGWPIGGRGRLRAVLPPGVRATWLPMVGPPQRALWRRVDLPPVEAWTGPIDVVHGANFVVPPAWRAAELVTVHDLTVVRHPEMCTADTLEFPSLVRRALDRGAWVHTVTDFVAGEVVELLGADPDRVVAIPNGVTVPERPGDPARGRALAGAERYVLALGTVEPRKGFPGLVAAFEQLATAHPDVRLVVAGPDGWGAAALTAAVDRSPVRDRTSRLGWVSDDQRADLLAGAAVLAYPSLYEGFGLPPLEAMAAGTPVVTTQAGAIVEVVGDAALTVPPGDDDALAAALDRVLGDDELAAALVARGHDRVALFSWDRTARELADLYRRLAEGRAQ